MKMGREILKRLKRRMSQKYILYFTVLFNVSIYHQHNGVKNILIVFS